MGTAERRIEMMKLLCSERYITMPNLAKRFGVSIRTVKRDIDELGFIIPLYIKSGRYDGGVYVMDGYFWSNAYMSNEDIALLENIKTIGESGGKLILDVLALERLKRIIKTYSLPQKNSF